VSGYGIAFALLVPAPLFWTLTAAAVALIGLAAARRAPGTLWRTAGAAILLLALANPTLLRETREPLTDIALLLVDESASQAVGARRVRAEDAIRHIRAQTDALDGLELRTVRAGADATTGGTKLYAALRRALADIPAARIGAAILVTDGRVHDAPGTDWRPGRDGLAGIGPVHLLLTGDRDALGAEVRLPVGNSTLRRLVLAGQRQGFTTGETVDVEGWAEAVKKRRGVVPLLGQLAQPYRGHKHRANALL